jgi:hypothetical protein
MIRPLAPILIACMALTGCGDGTNPFQITTAVTDTIVSFPDPGGASQVASNTITVDQSARSVALPATVLTENVIAGISVGSTSGHAVKGISVLAAAGVSDGRGFAGITGVTEAREPFVNATFVGNYAVTNTEGQSTNEIELIYSSTSNSLRNVGGGLTVNATSDGADLNGTVSFAGEGAALRGGFYSRDRIVAAFNGDTMGGVIFASR